jgi:cytoskeleton protein RodZ
MSDDQLESVTPKVSPGEILRAAREQAGKSQREVGDSLHLLPRQIDALEKDDYQYFNGDIFCRGYIRAYAKLFAIDSAPLITAYQQLCPLSQVKQTHLVQAVNHIQHPHKGRSIYYWSVAAIVLLAGILWVYGASREASLNTDIVASTDIVVDKNTLVSDLVEKEVIAVNDLSTDQSKLVDIALVEAGSDGTSSTDYNDLNESLLTDTTTIENTLNENVVESLDSNSWLVFDFKDDCWIEVKDRDNKVIYSALKRAKDTLKLNGKAPFKVLLGYAHGVSVNYNGEPVVFDVNQQNNAARLVIGQL